MSAIKKRLVELLNSLGLYTSRQYLHRVERMGVIIAYAAELEKAVNGMSDPARPIVIFADCVRVTDVSLLHGQQIIVSPHAKYAHLEKVYCFEKPKAPQAVPTEPSCPDCKAPDLLYECIHCSASNYPPAPKVTAVCEWTQDPDFEMGDTYHSSCGELWSFIDGGPKENRVSYCHHCGKPVKLVSAPQAVPAGWLPIESAPKPSGRVLLAAEGQTCYGHWYSLAEPPRWEYDGYACGNPKTQPTHWMKLPSPPKETPCK
jgi:hypothetical protein